MASFRSRTKQTTGSMEVGRPAQILFGQFLLDQIGGLAGQHVDQLKIARAAGRRGER